MPESPIRRYIIEFNKTFGGIANSVTIEIIKELDSVTSDADLIALLDKIFERNQVDQRVREAFLSGVTKSIGAGLVTFSLKSSQRTRDYLLHNAYSTTNVQFSQIVNDVTRKQEIIDIVRDSMRKNDAWRQAAQRLSDTNIQAQDIPKYIQRLEHEAREAFRLAGDPAGAEATVKALRRAKANIARLVDPSTSKLRRSYQDVIDAVERGSQKALEQSVRYAAYFKQRYNAERIIRTEMARAYGDAFSADILQDEDAIGYRSVLSTAHKIYDICDFYAKSNLYGMGKGVYPKDHGPPYPYHPHCTCVLEPVYKGEAPTLGEPAQNSERAARYLRSLPEQQRVMLLGRDGAAQFQKSPTTWAANMKNYAPEEYKRIMLPTDLMEAA